MNEKDHSAYRAIHIITRLYGGAKANCRVAICAMLDSHAFKMLVRKY